jgi:hypothetical protein
MDMFIWTAKLNKKKLVLTLTAALLVSAAAFTLLGGRGTAASATVSPKGVKTEEDRVSYLQEWGWQVSPQAALVEELALPEEFGEEYGKYLELQTGQGFDLTRYAGKRIRRYTYEVLNYPTGESGVVAHLLICKNTVIGGEILGGSFLHGLSMPE